ELALIRTTHLSNKAANDELLKYWGAFHDEGPATYSDLAHQTAPDGPDTDDMVFLLSFQEVERYFGEATAPYSAGDDDYPFCDMPESPAWIAYVTPAVEDNGQGYFDRRTGGGAWLTRTLSTAHASNGMMATYITGGGQVFNYLTYVPLFIRPAMWVRV
ncbi:MAG: hypothetical protein IJI59_16235, partial [Clostridia bacterium]|nr:hypothetical protein [Clostridia bacterium]